MAYLRQDEQPTLRLVTLRRLVRGTQPPIVLAQNTCVADVIHALDGAASSVVVLVDEDNVLKGTLRIGDLHSTDRMASAGDVMRDAPVLEAEQDIETARTVMSSGATDRVIVIGTTGELLGVLTERDVERKRAA